MRTFRKLLTVSFSGLQRCHYQTRSPLSLKSVFDHQTRSPFRGVEGMGLSKSLTFSNLRDSDPPSKSLTFTAQSVFHYQTRSPLGAMGLFHHQSRSPFDDFPIGLSKSLTFRPMRETSESVFLVVLDVLFFKKHTLWACAAGACCPLAGCVCLLQFKTTTVYRSEKRFEIKHLRDFR